MQALYERPPKLHRGAWQARIETLFELILNLGPIAIVVSQLSPLFFPEIV